MNPIQNTIHQLEVGGGTKFLRIGLAVLAVIFFTVGYNWRAFKNMSSPEAMDEAQLARNIAEGHGYTTSFVRPFSMFLIKRHNEAKSGAAPLGSTHDLAMIKGEHPDIANPPVYPFFLAALMKVLPFHYEIPNDPVPFWSFSGRFYRYQPDFLISFVNQVLLMAVAAITFFLARKLFDNQVAWLSAVLVFGTELLWRFSVSGLSTMLLTLILMVLAWCLVLMEEQGREPTWQPYRLFLLAAGIGALAALGALTRYSFAWLIVPVLLFVGFFSGARRVSLIAIAMFVFLLITVPWVIRNINVSGTPFGTAGYAILENTGAFPEFKLQRSLAPDMNVPILGLFWAKLMVGLRQIVGELPTIGGTWLTSFFLVGLILGFRSPAVKRLRYFILASILVLAVAQALVRTQLFEDTKGITTENLLVILTPAMIIYGCSLFSVLLEQIEFPFPQLRFGAIGAFGGVACLPLLLTFLPPKTLPIAWPPYNPPVVQLVGSWMKPNELVMSDIPWAMAWYGRRQSIWYTLDTQTDYFAINDYMKPINALYLTPVTMDSTFLNHWLQGGERSWGSMILTYLVRGQIPQYFPLRESPKGLMPAQLVLTDWPRWKASEPK